MKPLAVRVTRAVAAPVCGDNALVDLAVGMIGRRVCVNGPVVCVRFPGHRRIIRVPVDCIETVDAPHAAAD